MPSKSYHGPRIGVKLWRALRRQGATFLYMTALVLSLMLLTSKPSEASLIQALVVLAKVWDKLTDARH